MVHRTFDAAGLFVSAADFDVTGILTGVEPCASNYWWIPELQAAVDPTGAPDRVGVPTASLSGGGVETAAGPRHQAARRASPRSSTAAA